MQGIAILGSLSAFVAMWWWFNKVAKPRGWGTGARHATGALVGTIAFLCVLLTLSPAPETSAAAAVTEVDHASEPAPSEAAESKVTDATLEEIRALADETRAFLIQSDATIGFAAAASDAQAVKDEVEIPAFRLIMRWSDYTIASRHSYEDCFEALDAMHLFAARLTDADSADRRRSLTFDQKRFEAAFPKCEASAG